MTTTIVVAVAALVLTAPGVGAPEDWLGDQQERWRSFRRTTDRDAFLSARVLARCLLSEVVPRAGGIDPEAEVPAPRAWVLEQHCPACDRPHGRPSVVGSVVDVSWAHSDDVVAAAVSTSPVGVDVERVGTRPPPIPAGGGEHAWLRWTRMEALVKRGDGDLDTALGWPLEGPPALGGRPVRSFLPRHAAGGILTDAVAEDGSWVASVAATEPAALVEPSRVLRHLLT